MPIESSGTVPTETIYEKKKDRVATITLNRHMSQLFNVQMCDEMEAIYDSPR